jgi:hypothetical protein
MTGGRMHHYYTNAHMSVIFPDAVSVGIMAAWLNLNPFKITILYANIPKLDPITFLL